MALAREPSLQEIDASQRDEFPFDAKEYLERALPRQAGEVVKVCPMPYRNAFRVNWYRAAYVCRSQFLFCGLNAVGAPEITYPPKQ